MHKYLDLYGKRPVQRMILFQERLLYINIMNGRFKIKVDSTKMFFFDTLENNFALIREFTLLAKCSKQHRFESISDFRTYSRTFLVARYSDSDFFFKYIIIHTCKALRGIFMYERHIHVWRRYVVIHGGYSFSTPAINVYTWIENVIFLYISFHIFL